MSTGTIWKWIGIGILAIGLLTVGSWAYRWYTAPIKGKIEKREKTESADYRIYSYDHFYDLYHKVESYDKEIKNQKDLLEQTEDPKEKRRIRRNITGLKSQRSRAIEKYNSDARKEKTKGKFQPKDLPKRIDKRE